MENDLFMETVLDSEAIKKLLPHRYPFLFIDRIIELKPLERIVGIKQVSINESFFQGHFPGAPVMPGVLVIEALAQCMREDPDIFLMGQDIGPFGGTIRIGATSFGGLMATFSSFHAAGASRTSNLAPPAGRFDTRMRPRCDSTMSLAM